MLSISEISNTTLTYLPFFKRKRYPIYWILLLLVVAVLVSLPFVRTTIAVTAQGVTRPATERTDVKSVVGGVIDTIYYKEGADVAKGATLLRIKDLISPSKRLHNDFEVSQRAQFIHDINILTSFSPTEDVAGSLSSPIYKEQLSQFLHQKADYAALLSKASNDLEVNKKLVAEKVIARKDLIDAQAAYDKANADYNAFIREQQSKWQQSMAQYKLDLSQYQDERNQINTDASFYEIKAPVSGHLQGINDKYAGGIVQPNLMLCTISPDDSLIAECYVSPKDIGLVKKDQQVRFQIDAFNYNYFGIVTGRVITIDNDYTAIDNNTMVFKVRCRFDQKQVHLKNGFTGQLKKGLTFQARFVIGERSLWQLLWDKMDDWLNPTATQS